jgi:predicted glycosyltransferase
MGGYNTMCEILSQKTPSLIIPRETPRKEQLIRAQAFQHQQLIDYLPWNELTPQKLGRKINGMLANLQPYQQAMDQFELRGIDCIKQRLQVFREVG